MAKTKTVKEISAKDIDGLFVRADVVKSVKRNSRASFFDEVILNNVVTGLMAKGVPLDVNAFWDMAKIGNTNADKNHKCYYVNRAIKMALLNAKKSINLLEQNFNDPASSKVLKENLNNKAFRMSDVVLTDGHETTLLTVNLTEAFK